MHGRFLRFLWKSRFEIKLQCWFEITDLSKIICVCEKCKEHIYCLNTLTNKYFKTGVWECALLKKTDLPRSGMGYIINGFFTNTAIFEYVFLMPINHLRLFCFAFQLNLLQDNFLFLCRCIFDVFRCCFLEYFFIVAINSWILISVLVCQKSSVGWCCWQSSESYEN